MAFMQQQRRATNRYPKYNMSEAEEEEEEEEEMMYLRPRYNSLTVSDYYSDTDWHVLSSSCTSPILFASSETDSGQTEDESVEQQTLLPSHDGTGTFSLDTEEDEEEMIPCFIPTAAGVSSQQLVQLSDNTVLFNDSDSVVSALWDKLLRFRNHILENDTNTIERIGGLMSEAVCEGYIPFGSHLQMEFDNNLC